MPPRRLRPFIFILLALSFLPAAVLACGYFTEACVRKDFVGREMRWTSDIWIYFGHVEMSLWGVPRYVSNFDVPQPALSLHLTRPHWRQLWGFSGRWVSDPGIFDGALIFPIWCAFLPVLAIPLLYWRRHFRQRRAMLAGFPVQEVEARK